LAVLLPLVKFIGTLFISCSLLAGFLYSSILILYLKKPVLGFFSKIAPAITFAISTTSSGATLPVSIRCAEEGLRVSPRIAKFLLPLGCNFNLAGLAIYLTLAVIFTANMVGVTLTFNSYLTLISTVILTTMGAGAIPGSGIVVMSAVISSMGLPLVALPLIAGIDRISDMIQTATNVISDIFATYLIAESELQAPVSTAVNISTEESKLIS
jgi:Na+/H+-dicarboxylate symporter